VIKWGIVKNYLIFNACGYASTMIGAARRL